MRLPNDERGRETERRMLEWRGKNPDADTRTYNREFERVYNSLADQSVERGYGYFATDREIPQRDDDTSTETYSSRISTPKPPKIHFSKGKTKGTKGAFGKTKWKR